MNKTNSCPEHTFFPYHSEAVSTQGKNEWINWGYFNKGLFVMILARWGNQKKTVQNPGARYRGFCYSFLALKPEESGKISSCCYSESLGIYTGLPTRAVVSGEEWSQLQLVGMWHDGVRWTNILPLLFFPLVSHNGLPPWPNSAKKLINS
jgi:hypothetical protein